MARELEGDGTGAAGVQGGSFQKWEGGYGS